MDCSPLDSSVHGISQARILEWVAIFSSRGSSQPRNRTCISCFGRQILYLWATWEAPVGGYGQTNAESQTMGSVPQESSQLRSLCFLVSAHIINKCPFHGLICAPYPHIFVLSLAVLLFKKALMSCSGLLLGVSEHKRPWCALQRISVC